MNYHKIDSTKVQKVEFDRPQSTLDFFGWLYSNMSLKVVIFFSVVLGLGFLYFCGKWTKKHNRQQPYYFGKFDFRTVNWMTCIWSDVGLFKLAKLLKMICWLIIYIFCCSHVQDWPMQKLQG